MKPPQADRGLRKTPAGSGVLETLHASGPKNLKITRKNQNLPTWCQTLLYGGVIALLHRLSGIIFAKGVMVEIMLQNCSYKPLNLNSECKC